MWVKRLAITGGAGFVGGNLAVCFKTHYPQMEVVVIDNLKRRGSELNLSRLNECGIQFIHGDIRTREDLRPLVDMDLIIECSAEPSVLAGYDGNPAYLLNTNLVGTMNCLEAARTGNAAFVFLSTSRVYPHSRINQIQVQEVERRLRWAPDQEILGWSPDGITEKFSLEGAKTLYGASKLCSELLIQEYVQMYDLRAVINRCGLLAGPWQFGKVDQGVITYWMLCHYFRRELAYIGFGGEGKQVRDLLHIEDLFDLLDRQLAKPESLSGDVYNVGGGIGISTSLRECSDLCEVITGNRLAIKRFPDTRPGDVAIYISDTGQVEQKFKWKPRRSVQTILADIFTWVRGHESQLRSL